MGDSTEGFLGDLIRGGGRRRRRTGEGGGREGVLGYGGMMTVALLGLLLLLLLLLLLPHLISQHMLPLCSKCPQHPPQQHIITMF